MALQRRIDHRGVDAQTGRAQGVEVVQRPKHAAGAVVQLAVQLARRRTVARMPRPHEAVDDVRSSVIGDSRDQRAGARLVPRERHKRLVSVRIEQQGRSPVTSGLRGRA
jgi:hypothetical protein